MHATDTDITLPAALKGVAECTAAPDTDPNKKIANGGLIDDLDDLDDLDANVRGIDLRCRKK